MYSRTHSGLSTPRSDFRGLEPRGSGGGEARAGGGSTNDKPALRVTGSLCPEKKLISLQDVELHLKSKVSMFAKKGPMFIV